MTPLIQQYVARAPEQAINYHWFDLSAVYKKDQRIDAGILERRLPFPYTAVVFSDQNDSAFWVLLHQSKEITEVHSAHPDSPFNFSYWVEDAGVRVKHKDGTPFDYRNSPALGPLAFIATFLESLNVGTTIGYFPAKRANWDKKIRQGKVPTYDWKTILIEPAKPKGEDQGGTHASPRWHERRGHWRITRGKKVWVKNCEVGNKARGAVFHDYQIKEIP